LTSLTEPTVSKQPSKSKVVLSTSNNVFTIRLVALRLEMFALFLIINVSTVSEKVLKSSSAPSIVRLLKVTSLSRITLRPLPSIVTVSFISFSPGYSADGELPSYQLSLLVQ